MLRGLICADFVCGVSGVLFCCKVRAGLVVNVTTIIPQTDKALRVLLAIGFRVLNSILDIDFRLDCVVNGAHLTSCAVAHSVPALLGAYFSKPTNLLFGGTNSIDLFFELRNRKVARSRGHYGKRQVAPSPEPAGA